MYFLHVGLDCGRYTICYVIGNRFSSIYSMRSILLCHLQQIALLASQKHLKQKQKITPPNIHSFLISMVPIYIYIFFSSIKVVLSRDDIENFYPYIALCCRLKIEKFYI